jgi:hypothetical protein
MRSLADTFTLRRFRGKGVVEALIRAQRPPGLDNTCVDLAKRHKIA